MARFRRTLRPGGRLLLPPGRSALHEADWLLTCAQADGWIGAAPDRAFVRPYMASWGAVGLISAYARGYSTGYIDGAEAWVRWYAGHLDGSGYMHDWGVAWPGPVLTDLGPDSMDSTDAYIGMWLLALHDAWQARGGDLALLREVQAAVEAALTGLAATQQGDGLTIAKPSYTARYLEDNLETLAGLRGLQAMAHALGDPTLTSVVDGIADAMADGVAAMWNAETATWDWAIDANDTRTPADWGDESSRKQHAWAVALGATPADVAAAHMAAYLAAFPGWAASTTSGYEVMPVLALRRAGMTRDAAAGLVTLRATRDANDEAWPYGGARRRAAHPCRRVALLPRPRPGQAGAVREPVDRSRHHSRDGRQRRRRRRRVGHLPHRQHRGEHRGRPAEAPDGRHRSAHRPARAGGRRRLVLPERLPGADRARR
jgi:hypothetical protein